MNQATFIYLFLTIPLLIGGIIFLINSKRINDKIDKFEIWIRKQQQAASTNGGRLSKFIASPVLTIIVKLFNLTDSIAHRGLKNGTRVAVLVYLVVAWAYIICVLFILAVIIAIVSAIYYLIYKILGQYIRIRLFPNPVILDDILNYVGNKNEKVFLGTNPFNEKQIGRVDINGDIYKSNGWLSESLIGRINGNGNVYKRDNFFIQSQAGSIDNKGNIYRTCYWIFQQKIGRIDKSGYIYRGTFINEQLIGRSGY